MWSKGQWTLAAEVRLRVAKFGATPEDRARLRMVFADADEKDDKRRYHLTERSTGTYMRAFTLPFTPDRDKITADFDKGVLKVKVPRSPDQPKATKRIEIHPAA